MVYLAPIQKTLPIEKPLCELARGEQGRIIRIEDKGLKLALLRMGICEGDLCMFTGSAPMKGPISMLVGHTKISIRKRDAARVWIVMN